MKLISDAFTHENAIPKLYTCDGKDVSPPLVWSDVPLNAKSLALIVDDPDAPDPKAPKMTWVHWVLYNIPPDSSGLPEGVTASELLAGTRDAHYAQQWAMADHRHFAPKPEMRSAA